METAWSVLWSRMSSSSWFHTNATGWHWRTVADRPDKPTSRASTNPDTNEAKRPILWPRSLNRSSESPVPQRHRTIRPPQRCTVGSEMFDVLRDLARSARRLDDTISSRHPPRAPQPESCARSTSVAFLRIGASGPHKFQARCRSRPTQANLYQLTRLSVLCMGIRDPPDADEK